MAFKSSLAKDGPVFSRVVAGTMHWGSWGANLNAKDVASLIEQCIDHNITSFDLADIYGDYTTQALIGEALEMSNVNRDQIQLVSKCGICLPPKYEIHYYNTRRDYIIASVEQSLKDLRTDVLDLLLLHRPSPLMNFGEIAEAFASLRAAGKVKYFGVSNFSAQQYQLLNSYYPLVTNQVEASIIHLDPFLDGTVEYAQKLKMHPMAWSPLGGGALFQLSNQADFVLRRDRLRQISRKYDWELDEMAYAFLFHHPSRFFCVTGSSRIERILTAKRAFEKIHMTDEQWFDIWQASTGEDIP